MKKNYFTSFIMYILVFFPYIQIINVFGSDTQVNAAIFSTLVVILVVIKVKIKIPKNILLLFLFFIVALFVALLIKPININSLRQLFTYYSLFIVTYASYLFLKSNNGLNEKYLKLVMWIWFLVGFVQSYIYPEFLTFLLPRVTGGGARGVISLAPEPTYYATICIIFIFFAFKFKKNKKAYILLLIIQIILFAKSSMIIFFLILGVIFYFLAISNIKTIWKYSLIAIISVTLIVNGMITFFPDSRMSQNIIKIINDPISLVKDDVSINQRVSHVYYSVKGSLDNFLLPNGYNAVTEYFSNQTSDFFTYVGSPSKIMSGYGGILFELGIIGIGIFVSIHKSLSSFFNTKKKNFYFNIYLALLLFTAISMSNPMISFLIAYGTYLKNNRNEV